MPDITVKNLQGGDVETLSLSEEIFGVPVNVALMHQAVTRIQASASTRHA